MKLPSFLIAITLLVLVSGCTKEADKLDPNGDNTTDWIGTYLGNAGSTVNRIVISKVDNTTIRMELQTNFLGSFVTYATIAGAKLQSKTSAKIDEQGVIAGSSSTYNFDGSATRNGNSLTVSGKATSTTNATDVNYYYFTGNKQ